MRALILFILIISLTSPAYCQDKKCVIPINEINNKTLISVRICDVIIPNILLDSGFGFDGIVIFKAEYTDSLNLSTAVRATLPGAGEGEGQPVFLIDSSEFFVGNIKMTNQRIIILQNNIYEGSPSNGVIGNSIMGHYITEINYDNKTMTLHDSGSVEIDSSWYEIPIYFKGNNIPWIDIKVVIDKGAPVNLSAYIDYAAGDAILLLEKPNMKFDLPEEIVDVHIGKGLSGDIYGQEGRISKLIIGEFELNNVVASIASSDVRSKQDNADAILGVTSLRRFNLIFDYYNKKLFLKPNNNYHDLF